MRRLWIKDSLLPHVLQLRLVQANETLVFVQVPDAESSIWQARCQKIINMDHIPKDLPNI